MLRIAIDGPGGAGKSSVAKAVAKELGIIYVDTGALYRNIGLYMLCNGIDPKDSQGVISALDSVKLELKFENGRQVILLNGVDEGDRIRTPEASMAASAVSAIPEVRKFLLDMQRNTAKKNSVIMDGRDIGTVILPNAEVKIFMTASAKARAERRYKELLAKGQDVTFEKVYEEMLERDKNDSERDVAPCVAAEDAVLLDNSRLDEKETVKAVLKIVKKKYKPYKFYNRCKIIVAPLYRFFMRVKVKGKENVPKEGGIIIAANHIAAVDVISIGAVCPRPLTCIAKKELFSVPVLKFFMKGLGAISVDRGNRDIGAMKSAVSAAEEGKVLTIFPQGHRYPGVNPATTPIHNGVASIAYHSGCDVLPVSINVKKGKYAPLRRVEVVFGKPIKYEELGFKEGGREEYKEAAHKIFNAVCELGIYSSLPAYLPAAKAETKDSKES